MDPEIRTATEKALGLIRSGWTKGAAVRNRGSRPEYCMLGANYQACGRKESAAYWALVHEQARIIREQYPELFGNTRVMAGPTVINFNDSKGTTHDQVIAIYEKMLAE